MSSGGDAGDGARDLRPPRSGDGSGSNGEGTPSSYPTSSTDGDGTAMGPQANPPSRNGQPPRAQIRLRVNGNNGMTPQQTAAAAMNDPRFRAAMAEASRRARAGSGAGPGSGAQPEQQGPTFLNGANGFASAVSSGSEPSANMDQIGQPQVFQRMVNGQVQTMVRFPSQQHLQNSPQQGQAQQGQAQQGQAQQAPQFQMTVPMEIPLTTPMLSNASQTSQQQQGQNEQQQQHGPVADEPQQQQPVPVQFQSLPFPVLLPVNAAEQSAGPVVAPTPEQGSSEAEQGRPQSSQQEQQQQRQRRTVQFQMAFNSLGQPVSAAGVPIPVPMMGGQALGRHVHPHLNRRLPPLEPQPVPFDHRAAAAASSPPSSGGDGNGSDENLQSEGEQTPAAAGAMHPPHLDSTIECSICYDVMDEPTRLPCCDARFCRSCAKRLLSVALTIGERNGGEVRPEAAEGRCPCCRTPFLEGDMKSDEELRRTMDLAEMVPCPFPNCNARIALRNVKKHHASCEYMPVKCRYSPFGCKWFGPRKDIKAHEEVGCHLAKVSTLVDRIRQSDEEHKALAHQLAHTGRALAQTQMFLHQTRADTMRMQRRVRPERADDIIGLIFMALCYTKEFLREKDWWKPMWESTGARAKIDNFLTILPLFFWVIRIAASTPRLFRNFFASPDELAQIRIIFCAMLLILQIGCYIFLSMDIGDPDAWKRYQLKSLFRIEVTWPLFRDGMAIFYAGFIHIIFLAMFFDDSIFSNGGFTVIHLGLCNVAASVVFPSLMRSLLHAAAKEAAGGGGGQSNMPLLVRGKAREAVVFGLRYGMLAGLFVPFFSLLDAMVVLRLFLGVFDSVKVFGMSLPKVFAADLDDCLLSDPGNTHLIWAIMAARGVVGGFQLGQDYSNDLLMQYLTDVCVSLAFLISMNLFLHFIDKVGTSLGRKILADAASSIADPQGNAGNARRSVLSTLGVIIPLGSICFLAWIASLCTILIA